MDEELDQIEKNDTWELVPVMSPLWDIITGQRFMMTRVARWVLERVQGYLRGIVGSSLH